MQKRCKDGRDNAQYVDHGEYSIVDTRQKCSTLFIRADGNSKVAWHGTPYGVAVDAEGRIAIVRGSRSDISTASSILLLSSS